MWSQGPGRGEKAESKICRIINISFSMIVANCPVINRPQARSKTLDSHMSYSLLDSLLLWQGALHVYEVKKRRPGKNGQRSDVGTKADIMSLSVIFLLVCCSKWRFIRVHVSRGVRLIFHGNFRELSVSFCASLPEDEIFVSARVAFVTTTKLNP